MRSRPQRQNPRAVTLRFGGNADVRALTAFYTKNQHPYVAFRVHRLAPLLEQQSFILAESGSAVVAAGGFECHEMDGSRPYVELIQGRVLRSGAGLYRLLIAWRVLAIDVRYKGEATIFCEVDEVNTRARSVYEHLGFQRFAPGDELYIAAIESLPNDKRPAALGYSFVWYYLPSPVKVRLLATLRAAVGGNDYSAFIDLSTLVSPSAALRHLTSLQQ